MSETSFLDGGGELGELMRGRDWTQTPLGEPASWPRALKTAVRILLTSRQPFWLGWGPELTYLYNDPYKSIIGGKHPKALGRPFREVWHEIWDVVGPMAERVMTRDEGTYVEAQLLVMERHGYQEETYYTFSYSPIPGDHGQPGGLICANTDDTRRVIGERQLATLRELAARTAPARSWREACSLGASVLEANARDVPFVSLYVSDLVGEPLVLVAASRGSEAASEIVRGSCEEVIASGEPRVVDLDRELAGVPAGAWPIPPVRAAVLPIATVGASSRAGALVVGLNPYRQFDESYRGFLELAAHQVGAAIANAEAYEQERQRAEALAELDRAKTTFFSNVSHEFRTPLTLLLGPLEDIIAQSEALPAAVREQIAVAHRNALRLLKLVNTLLDFSRIEAGRTQTTLEPIDLAETTSELASMFRSAFERAGLRMVVDCPPLPSPVHVDRELWEKIVLNLLSNAFKFTFEGEVAIRLRRSGDHVVLTVRDTGTGIPAAELPHLFERFHRVKGARGRTFEGSGIGLALVYELVKLHGGAVEAESEIDRGSEFRVMLPVGTLPSSQRAEQPRKLGPTAVRGDAYLQEMLGWLPPEAGPEPKPVSTSAAENRSSPRGAPRILLADDNADMREYVRRLLAERYEVEAVADGRAALAAARERPPDLVLSDVMMPELDGFGLMQAMRADERLRSVPIVLLSARAGEAERVEGLGAGADDYLVKPFGARELLARVATRLELSRLHAQRLQLISHLREDDRRKDEFLATLSHELRNPLAPLRNALHVLRLSGPGAAPPHGMHEMMQRQIDHLVRLVDDLLEMSRISRGKLELRNERVEIETIVRNAIETSASFIESAGHELEVALPDAPIWVEGDPVRLSQILANLLNNSAKYTDPGGKIRVCAVQRGDTAEVSVRDNGAGISPEALPHLFDMFSRGDQASGRGPGGLGVGLALAHRLAEMHGGSLEAASAGPGKGSQFVLRVPMSVPPSADGARRGPSDRALVRTRILVVDDNLDAAQSLGMLLELLGAEVHLAHDGPSALQALADHDPLVVLLDIGMPGMDGYEVARRMRADLRPRSPLLVALTGWGQEHDRKRALEAGFDHHLVKPADVQVLQDLLASLPQAAPGES